MDAVTGQGNEDLTGFCSIKGHALMWLVPPLQLSLLVRFSPVLYMRPFQLQTKEQKFATMNEQDFVQTMASLKGEGGDLKTTIRAALTAVLGELPAIVALSYTGDAEDGDLESFVRRTEELFGVSAPTVLTSITSWAVTNLKGS